MSSNAGKPMITITDAASGPNRVTLHVQGQKPVTVANHPDSVANAISRINRDAK